MALRIFADQCVSNFVVVELKRSGYDVLLLRDYLRVNAPDQEVIAKAQELEAVLISLDGDFSDIVTYPPEQYLGIIALQIRSHPEVLPQMMMRLLGYLGVHPDREHYHGKLFLVEAHRIRIRS